MVYFSWIHFCGNNTIPTWALCSYVAPYCGQNCKFHKTFQTLFIKSVMFNSSNTHILIPIGHKTYFHFWRVFHVKWKAVLHLILVGHLLNVGRKSNLSEAVKFRIVYLHKEEKTQLFIAKGVKCSQASVNRILKACSNNKYFQNKFFQSGRKSVT